MKIRGLVCLLALLLALPAGGDPIQPKGASPYSDRTAARPGDVVEILVKDVTSVVQKIDAQKQRNSQANLFGLSQLLSAFFAPSSLNNSSLSGTTANDSNSEQFESALAATVMSVTPRGNLVLEGHRVVVLNGQRQELILTGQVRPEDLAADNSVPSNRISNLAIHYKGPLRGQARRGIIQSVLEILF